MPAGTLIAIEGIDGAGKHTQAELLERALLARGIACRGFSFPVYESFFGRLIASFLNGEFGQLPQVDPHLSALLYAGDRFEAKPALQGALAAGQTIVTDRYVGSNLAHQTARVAPADRTAFLSWLRQLEYDLYGMPAEDLVIFLHRAPAQAQQLVARKSARNYTDRKHDLQEANLSHLEEAAQVYEQLAREPNWVTVECANGDTAKTPEAIHREVLATVEARVLSRSAAP